MYTEIQECVAFLCSFLQNKIPRRKIDLFAEQLANNLLLKFIQLNWLYDEPKKDADQRRLCVNVTGTGECQEQQQPINDAAGKVWLDHEELLAYLPTEMYLYVNPGAVSYSVGASANATCFYTSQTGSQRRDTPQRTDLQITFNHEHNCYMFSLPPTTNPPHTVGSFAMTRFGSSKNKVPKVTYEPSSSGAGGNPPGLQFAPADYQQTLFHPDSPMFLSPPPSLPSGLKRSRLPQHLKNGAASSVVRSVSSTTETGTGCASLCFVNSQLQAAPELSDTQPTLDEDNSMLDSLTNLVS